MVKCIKTQKNQQHEKIVKKKPIKWKGKKRNLHGFSLDT